MCFCPPQIPKDLFFGATFSFLFAYFFFTLGWVCFLGLTLDRCKLVDFFCLIVRSICLVVEYLRSLKPRLVLGVSFCFLNLFVTYLSYAYFFFRTLYISSYRLLISRIEGYFFSLKREKVPQKEKRLC